MEYPAQAAVWQTPKGHSVNVHYRGDTSDWNTVSSIMAPHDEYGLKDLSLSGLALDIGSHIGAATLALAMDNPGLRVIAVEPVSENCDLIRRNVFVNNLAAYVRVIEGAAGKGGTTWVRFRFTGTENDEHHAFIGNVGLASPEAPHQVAEVESFSLSSLLAGEECAFMKIDCEGGEYDFLDDAVSLVQRIHGEWHPTPGHGREGRDEIAALLDKTHEVTFSGPAEGPGGFRAVRR